MRIVLQRVKNGSVKVDGEEIAAIGTGVVLLVGFGPEDGEDLPGSRVWTTLLNKIAELRIFPGEGGKVDRSLLDVGGEVLAVSQFTLYADCRKGRRPSFSRAAAPDLAARLFDRFVEDLGKVCPAVKKGRFGADMDVSLCNWGPVTLVLDSAEF